MSRYALCERCDGTKFDGVCRACADAGRTACARCGIPDESIRGITIVVSGDLDGGERYDLREAVSAASTEPPAEWCLRCVEDLRRFVIGLRPCRGCGEQGDGLDQLGHCAACRKLRDRVAFHAYRGFPDGEEQSGRNAYRSADAFMRARWPTVVTTTTTHQHSRCVHSRLIPRNSVVARSTGSLHCGSCGANVVPVFRDSELREIFPICEHEGAYAYLNGADRYVWICEACK